MGFCRWADKNKILWIPYQEPAVDFIIGLKYTLADTEKTYPYDAEIYRNIRTTYRGRVLILSSLRILIYYRSDSADKNENW